MHLNKHRYKKLLLFGFFILLQLLFIRFYVVNSDKVQNTKLEYVQPIYIPSYKIILTASIQNLRNNFFSLVSSGKNTISNISNLGEEKHAKSLPILAYHGVVFNEDGSNILLGEFREHMSALKKAGYRTVTLQDALEFMKNKKGLPEKSFLLTFDDGRKDSYYPVDPILQALGFNAVIFVITEHSLDDEVDSDYYLNASELKDMLKTGRWEVQVHTDQGHDLYDIDSSGKKGHYYSNKLWVESKERIETDQEFKERITRDLKKAKNQIQEKLDTNVVGFAYPFGDYGQEQVNYPDAEKVLELVVKPLFPLSFYQVRVNNGYSQNYPPQEANSNSYKLRRIEPRYDWTPSNLLNILRVSNPKNIPFTDDFTDYNGWINTWGKTELSNGNMVNGSNFGTQGNTNFLDGTFLWRDYIFSADIEWVKGETVSLLARYIDESNYVSCTFSYDNIRINKRSKNSTLKLSESKIKIPKGTKFMKLSIAVQDDYIVCLLNGKIIVESMNLENKYGQGGIGFSTWSREKNSTQINVLNISVN